MNDKPHGGQTNLPPARVRAMLFEPSTRVSSGRDVFELVFKHLSFVLGVFGSVMILSVVFVYLRPPVYEATAKVAIERGKRATQRSDLELYPLEPAEVIMSEIEIARSRTVAEEVVDTLGLPERPVKNTFGRRVGNRLTSLLDRLGLVTQLERREKLILMVQKDLRVEPAPQSSVLVISYRAESAGEAAEIARAATESYLAHHRRVFADNAAAFFQERVRETNRELAALRARLRRETDPSQSESLLLNVSVVEKEYAFYRDKWSTARAEMAADKSMVNVRVVDYPVVPGQPARSRLFYLVLAGLGGMILAVSLALVREYLDHAIYSARDIEEFLDLPVLGSVRFVAGGPGESWNGRSDG